MLFVVTITYTVILPLTYVGIGGARELNLFGTARVNLAGICDTFKADCTVYIASKRAENIGFSTDTTGSLPGGVG